MFLKVLKIPKIHKKFSKVSIRVSARVFIRVSSRINTRVSTRINTRVGTRVKIPKVSKSF